MKFLIIFKLIYFFDYYIAGHATNSGSLIKEDLGFIFTYPMVMFSEVKTTACLNLYNVVLPTKVIIDMKVNKLHHITSINVSSENSCFPLNVPNTHQQYKVPANIDLQVRLNNTISWYSADDVPFIYPNAYTTFIETDRAFYKMGEKVKIRFLVLDQNLRPPTSYKITDVKLYNPFGNTVAVWNTIPTELGLALQEFQLADDTTLGKWKIEANGYTRAFHVKRYILPRFQVKIFTPKILYAGMKSCYFHICAKYSYGEHVQGTAAVKVSYPINSEIKEVHKTKEMKDGCLKFRYTDDDLRFQDDDIPERYLFITGAITEKETNVTEVETIKVRVVRYEYQIKFSDEQEYFQPGLPYKGKLKLTNIIIPLKNEIIQICCEFAVKKVWNIKQRECKNFTVNSETVINFNLLPMKENVVQLNLQALPISRTNYAISATMSLKKWHSKSHSVIHIERHHRSFPKCGSALQFTIFYVSDLLKEFENVTFNYILTSKGEIVKNSRLTHTPRKKQLNISDLKNVVGNVAKFVDNQKAIDSFSFKIQLDNVYTKTNLIVYYIVNEEVVAAHSEINVEKCLPNNVKAKWSHNRLYPGETAELQVNTDSNSLCSVAAIDKSITFLGSFKTMSPETILKSYEHPEKRLLSYKRNCLSTSAIERPANLLTNPWDLRRKRQTDTANNFITQEHSSHFDTYEIFKRNNMGVISNMRVISKPCEKGQTKAHFLIFKPNTLEYEVENEEHGSSIRKYFPESWIWDLVPVGKGGNAVLERRLPDTITTWVTNVMCISPYKGIGLSHTIEITSYKPFFLDVLTPNSIKIDEILHLPIVAHNYLNHSIPVRVILEKTDGSELMHGENSSVIFCLKEENIESYTYRVKFYKLGLVNITVSAVIDYSYPKTCGPDVVINRRDVVYKSIFVESEGYSGAIVKSAVVCINDSVGYNNVSWEIKLPKDVVPSSTRSKVILNSDLMGPVIQNLENLLVVPTGCGEQIMSVLTPNLYILRYLKSTNNLTKVLYQRAIRNMKIGYQRILDYAHRDGSFSAFGYHDPNGSMFLTAFVVRSLRQMKEYVHVDENVIRKAVDWITKHQLENGCFDSGHHVFHELGGMNVENSTAALTAYVLISLLESNTDLNDTVRTNAKYCIRGSYQPNKYTLAISTYALYLVEWYSQADRTLQKLLQIATKEGNLLWWSQPDLSLSVSIEMTSYVLMSLLYRNSSQNLYYASSIVRWLHTKIGIRGEFSSTQDTSVALDALSRYAVLIHRQQPELNITISSERETKIVSISRRDQMKMKQIHFDDIPLKVKINIDGEGCILAQAAVTYSVYHFNSSQAFALAVDVEPVSTIDKCSVATISPCLAYTGPGHSNMAVLEIAMPSGYEPDRDSLFALAEKENTRVKRFEELANHVVLYFTELTNEPVCVPFTISENIFVENIINATIKLYDYYKPELKVVTSYRMNTCESNVIAPVPALPGSTTAANYSPSADRLPAVSRRRRQNNAILDNFFNIDVDLETPQGLEGNTPVYVIPPNMENDTNYIAKN